ncbi:MAG: hypothetical protein JO244_09570 [Solirubrobacterales bacterium]|nr:hypothetical protein [Solirubrobacterales bacterium]
MLSLATNWSTVSSLATGAGTLVLAVATFAAVRSSNRSARIAEQALQEQRRPIFTQSRLDDPLQKIMFVEGHWVRASGGHGVAEHDGAIYLAISLRNVGAGIGVCQGWHASRGLQSSRTARDHTPEDQFRLQTRDLYIPAGDVGMWQGALRDRNDPTYQAVAEAIDNRDIITIELLYSDQVGAQRTISRFGLSPYEIRNEKGEPRVEWFASINRHWYLDRAGPRSDEQVDQAVDLVLREREAADQADQAEAAAEEAEVAAEAATAEATQAKAAAADEAETNGARANPEPDDQADDGIARPEPVAVVPRPNCE